MIVCRHTELLKIDDGGRQQYHSWLRIKTNGLPIDKISNSQCQASNTLKLGKETSMEYFEVLKNKTGIRGIT